MMRRINLDKLEYRADRVKDCVKAGHIWHSTKFNGSNEEVCAYCGTINYDAIRSGS